MIVKSSLGGVTGKYTCVLLGLMFLIFGSMQAQDAFCADFKEGSFYIPPTDELPVSYKITRQGESLVETVASAPKGLLSEEAVKPKYGVIKWIDECSYRIWFDESKGPLDEVQQMINRNNGVLIEFLSMDGNCVNYRGTLEKPDEIVTFLGQQCKD